MINKKELQKVVSHIIKRDRGIPDKRLLHPKREWGFAVFLVFVTVLVGGAYAFMQYQDFSQLSLASVDVEAKIFEYDRGDALESIEVYGAFQERYDGLVADRPVYVAPVEEVVEQEEVESEEGEGSQENTDEDSEGSEAEAIDSDNSEEENFSEEIEEIEPEEPSVVEE